MAILILNRLLSHRVSRITLCEGIEDDSSPENDFTFSPVYVLTLEYPAANEG